MNPALLVPAIDMKRIFLWCVVLYLFLWAKLALFIARPREVIGIAGSVGKSSTRILIYEILRGQFATAMLSGNSETGIALSALGIWPKDYSVGDWLRMLILAPFGIFHLVGKTHIIVEMGTDDFRPPKNMGFLLGLVKPTIAVHMNATATHTEQFSQAVAGGDMEAILDVIATEDGRIMTESGCHVAIYNSDDSHIASAVKSFLTSSRAHIMTFGSEGNISLVAHEVRLDGTLFRLRDSDGHSLRVQVPQFLLPTLYWENCAAALLAARALGIPDDHSLTRIKERFQLPKSRGSIFAGVNDSLILDSSYNNSRVPMQMYLNMVSRLAKETYRDLIIVMGDMRELGDQTQSEHEAIARELVKIAPTFTYCVGEATKQYVMPQLPKTASAWYKDSRALGDYLRTHLPREAIVLIKGSQNTIFLEETVVRLLNNPQDATRVCRMDAGWQQIKNRYFSTIESPAS